MLPAAYPASGQPHHASPIFFVTDRELRAGKSALDFGAQKNDPLDHVTYGAIGLTITGDDNSNGDRADQTPTPAERIYTTFSDFAGNLRAAVTASNREDVVIFVHGCCVGFREAVRQSERLSDHVKTTVVLYDWGSPFGSYSGSLLTHPRSQERFNSFMRAIALEFPKKRIAIVGLSMGNILIFNFLLQHHPHEINKTFDQITFARADMDSVAFQTHLPRIVVHARKIFVYVDNRDFLINLSQAIRVVASPTEHGQRVGRLTKGLRTGQPVTFVDVSPLKLRHELPCGVVSDLLASDGAVPNTGQYKYVELADGIVQARRK